MTSITIPLKIGPNYISFPATSTENFGNILAGIKDIIEIVNDTRLFYRYDPILPPYWLPVDDIDFIEQGRGYYISVTSPGELTYEGVEYYLTIEQLRSRILRGWNLVGTGSNALSMTKWCKVIDPTTGFPIAQLEPTKSYWVDYYDCVEPVTEPILLIASAGLLVSIISLYAASRRTRT